MILRVCVAVACGLFVGWMLMVLTGAPRWGAAGFGIMLACFVAGEGRR